MCIREDMRKAKEEKEVRMIICRGGRTGRKLHAAFAGSSCLNCGHWLRASASYFKVAELTKENVEKFRAKGYEMCEKCFGQK